MKYIGYLSLFIIVQSQLFAADKVASFFQQANDWVISSVGPGIITFGLIFSAFSGMNGRPESVMRGVYVSVGGLLITAAPFISSLIVGWAQ